MQYLPINWQQYQSLALSLAEKLLNKEAPFDEIVAIARGGLTLGHLLSDYLNLPICSITIQSYTDIQKQGELRITAGLKAQIGGKRILLVDDIADTGKTLKRAIGYLKRFRPAKITTVTMFYKPHSTFKPDYFVEQTGRWVIFPHEQTETILLLTKAMKKQKKSDADIRRLLHSLNFTDHQIVFVQKHYKL
ncbi:phosphoribosyltransferase [Candidatus Gottesmanbacteria bacterium]|nr:phosphoribosyltransferase [Candidatus Gottesmanbacteria bacterium]